MNVVQPIRFALSLAGLMLPGCFLPFAAPSASIVPPVRTTEGRDEVHVFRVDVRHSRELSHAAMCNPFAIITPPPLNDIERYELSELDASPEGKIGPQVSVSCVHGWIRNGVPDLARRSVRVRLYRRGFQTVEVKGWQLPHSIHWEPAGDWRAQEKAIDALLGNPRDRSGWSDARRLELGSKSEPHRNALLFAAAEYEQLVALAPVGKEKDWLTSKVASLRKLAAGEQDHFPEEWVRPQAGP